VSVTGHQKKITGEAQVEAQSAISTGTGETMNRRTRQFWLPAVFSLGATMVVMMVLQKWELALQAPWRHSGVPILPYLVWIVVLPVIGAVTTAISARTGAGALSRLAAVLSPALLMLAIWFFILGFGAHRPVQWLNFFFGLILWAGLPGVCLVLGDWIFLSTQNSQNQRASNMRQRKFWMPALASLCLSVGILALSSNLGGNSYVLAHGWSNKVVYLPWILLSPFCGAAGAYLSRRAGGSFSARLAAGLFPAIAMLGLGILLASAGAISFAAPKMTSFWRGLVAGIIVPSVALALGALPFLSTPAAGTPKIPAAALK
jgi:hypothetical protein